jgi:phosphopentomutase
VDNSTIEFSKSIRLSLSYIPSGESYELLIMDIKQVLRVTQIHHLEISEEKLCFDMLMQIINSLPQVTTMKIHSLSLDQAKDSETDELIVFPSTESINQITKVYLEKMFTIEEVYSLMKLCRYMSYLKINSFDNMNASMFIRNTLKKINRDSNKYLRLLCFPAPASDDQMIKSLEKMKKDYTINRIDNYLFLQWK